VPFGVYYVGQTPLLLSAGDLEDYVHVHTSITTRLELLDLRAGNAIVLGVSTDAVRAR
jgi:hypothetical protein